MEDETRRTSSFMLFVLLAYGAIWGLFGLGRWLEVPFAMDPRAPGGVFYLIGAALPSACAIIVVLFCERREACAD
jgi:polyferredoxin